MELELVKFDQLIIILKKTNFCKKWLKFNREIKKLQEIISYIKYNIDLQDLSNKCNSINAFCKGNGSGLLGGSLIDIFISEYFTSKLTKYEECRDGEADMKLCGVCLSQKKINGKSIIALDWSKNKNKVIKDYFLHHILIINLKTEKWWKLDTDRNMTIYSGIYIINKTFCKKNVILSSNNKTDSLIDNKSLYSMIQNSINTNLYIIIPDPNQSIKFNILNAFL